MSSAVRSDDRPRPAAHAQFAPAPGARKAAQPLYCEIAGLPVELDPAELSSAGFFVETPQPAAVDSELEVFLRIGEARFEAVGHVVKSVSCEAASRLGKRPGYAVLLANLDESQRKRLSGAIAECFPPAQRQLPPAPPPQPPPAQSRTSPRDAGGQQTVPLRAAAQKAAPPRAAAAPAASPEPMRVDAEEEKVLGQLKRELAQLGGKTAWATLGISQGAARNEVTTAFHRASKRYHPHLFARYAHPEIKRVVTELFIAHKRAYTSMLKTCPSSSP